MRGHTLLRTIAGCALACAALLLPGAAAQYPGANCMSGIPCGQFCAPIGGGCIRGNCHDASGVQVQCYAPMAQMNAGPVMGVGFPPFLFQPFAPMPPMVPMVPSCGGQGPCASNEFCDVSGVCRPNDCISQYRFGCPDDRGQLQEVACPQSSGFNRCYASTSGGFSCNQGASGGSVACASRNGGSSTATMSSSYQGPNGASTGGFASSSSSFMAGPQAQPGQRPITTTGPSTVRVVQQPPVTAAASGRAAAGAGADAAATGTAANGGPVQPVPPSTAGVAPAAGAGAGAGASGETVPASGSSSKSAAASDAKAGGSVPASGRSSNSAATSGAKAASSNPPEVPVLQPVISTVNDGAATGTGVPSAAANKAASTATSKTATGATKSFITEGGPTRQTYVTPDGTTETAVGSDPSGISVTKVAPDGSSMASGSAVGGQQTVTTTTIPGGSSVTSTSYSNDPAGASAVAGSSSGAGSGGEPPLYTPYTAPGNVATAQFVGGNTGAGTAGSSDSAAAATTRPPINSAGSGAAPAWMLGAAAVGVFAALWM